MKELDLLNIIQSLKPKITLFACPNCNFKTNKENYNYGSKQRLWCPECDLHNYLEFKLIKC